MQLVTYRDEHGAAAGAIVAGGVEPLGPLGYSSVIEVLQAGRAAWTDLSQALSSRRPTRPLAETELLAPIPVPPRNMFCVALNYHEHLNEGGSTRDAAHDAGPMVFTKPWTSIVGPNATVAIDPRVTAAADWEAELAVVIGTEGVDIEVDDALEHVFGAMLANDLSARDLQLAHGPRSQWFKGKALDGFCPLGPVLVSLDELGSLDSLEITLTLGDVVMQRLDTALMIHSVAEIVAYLSKGMRLLPGDVILTGTGAGVGHWQKPPRYLRDGDSTTVSCPPLGSLHTMFTAASGGSR